MAISVTCKCGKRFKVADKFAGKKAKCPSCGIKLVVPNLAPPEPNLPPPSAAFELETPDASRASEFLAEVEHVQTPPDDIMDLEPPTSDQVLHLPKAPQQDEVPHEPTMFEVTPGKGLAATDQTETLPATGDGAKGAGTCPKCGAEQDKGAIVCIHCGEKLASAQPETAAASGKARSQRWVMLAIIGSVVLLVALILVLGVVVFKKVKDDDKDSEVARQPGSSQDSGETAKQQPEQPGKKDPKQRPRRALKTKWEGFKQKGLRDRDALLAIGEALARHLEERGQPPASLAQLDAPAARQGGFKLLNSQILGLTQFHPVAHAVEPDEKGRYQVLFSDGAVRPVAAEKLQSIIPKLTASGWLTAADRAVLSQLAPVLSVTNSRFPSLVVKIDGATRATVPRHSTQQLKIPPGDHRFSFTAREASTKETTFRIVGGFAFKIFFPRHQDLPRIPVKTYRQALPRGSKTYEAKRKDNVVKTLSSEDETIIFGDLPWNAAIPREGRSIAAVIRRKDHTLIGIGNAPIRVSEMYRLEEGILQRHGGPDVTNYYNTSLGAIAIEKKVNTAVASIFHVPSQKPERKAPRSAQQWRPRYGPSRTRRPPVVVPKAPSLITAKDTFAGAPDFLALTGALRGISAEVTPRLLRHARTLQKEPEPEEGAFGMSPGTNIFPPPDARIPGRSGDRDYGGSRTPPGRGQGARSATTARSIAESALTPATAVPKPLGAEAVFFCLAFYSESSASNTLVALSASSNAQADHIIAMARCGGGNAIGRINSAAKAQPAAAAIAYAIIDDPFAMTVLHDQLAGASVSLISKVGKVWPVGVGQAARRRFVEATIAAKPNARDDVVVLNALLRIDAATTERVVLASFLAATVPGKKVEQKKKPEPAKRPDGRPIAEPPSKPRAVATPPSWRMLAMRKNTKAVERLLEILQRGEDKKKVAAVNALAEARDAGLAGLLSPHLRSPLAGMSRAAARALLLMKDKGAADAVMQAMNKEMTSGRMARIAAANADKIGRAAAADLLAKMLVVALQNEPPPKSEEEKEQERESERREHPRQREERLRRAQETPAPVAILKVAENLGIFTTAMDNAIQQACKSNLPDTRAAAFRTLAAMKSISSRAATGNPSAIREFLKTTRIIGKGGSSSGRGGATGFSETSIQAAAQALKDPAAVVRIAGVQVLRGAPANIAMTYLNKALRDKDPKVRIAAVEIIALLKGRSPSIGGLLQRALMDRDVEVIAAAVRVAVQRRDSSVGPALIAALNRLSKRTPAPKNRQREEEERRREDRRRRDDEPEIKKKVDPIQTARIALMRAIGELQVANGAGALQLMLSHEDSWTRTVAAMALGQLKDARAVPVLVERLRDSEPQVCKAAVVALIAIDTPAGNRTIINALVDQKAQLAGRDKALALFVRLASASEEFRQIAMTGPELSPGDLQILATQSGGVQQEEYTGYRTIAKRYLKMLPKPKDSERRDGDDRPSREELRRIARHQYHGHAQAEPDRIQAPPVRISAAQILANLRGDAEARTLLFAALKTDASGVSEAVAKVIERTRDPEEIESLRLLYKAVSDSLKEERSKRNWGLAKASQEESRRVRMAIIVALAQIESEATVPALRRITAYEKDPSVRRHVLGALTKIGTEEAVRHIANVALWSTEYLPDVIKALQRAGHANPELTRTTLQKIIRSPRSSPQVKAQAADALDELASRLASGA